MRTTFLCPFFGAIALLGCSGRALDVGSNGGGGEASTDGGTSSPNGDAGSGDAGSAVAIVDGSEDASGSDGGHGSGPLPPACGSCTGSAAAEPLIDDMGGTAGTNLLFAPPGCATWYGNWWNYGDMSGITPPVGEFAFSPLPAPLPPDAGAPAGSTPKAACMGGVTGPAQYEGMGFSFGYIDAPDGGGPPVFIDASSYAGLEFWAWTPGDAGAQNLTVVATDKYEQACFGVCNPSSTGPTACASAAQMVTLNPGWQLVELPFANFTHNGNEVALDPGSLTTITFNLGSVFGTPTPFDVCLYRVSFY